MNNVVVVTSGEVTLSNNESGGQHMKVVLDHENADASLRKYTLVAPHSLEVNGAVIEFDSPSGKLLEVLSLPEFKKRFPRLVTEPLMATGFCQLLQNPNGTFYCGQGNCTGTCQLHNWPAWCECT